MPEYSQGRPQEPHDIPQIVADAANILDATSFWPTLAPTVFVARKPCRNGIRPAFERPFWHTATKFETGRHKLVIILCWWLNAFGFIFVITGPIGFLYSIKTETGKFSVSNPLRAALKGAFYEFFVARGKDNMATTGWFWPCLLYLNPWILQGMTFLDFNFRAWLFFYMIWYDPQLKIFPVQGLLAASRSGGVAHQ